MRHPRGKKHTKEGKEKEEMVRVLYIDNSSGFGGSITSLKNTLRGLDRAKYLPVVVAGHEWRNASDDVVRHKVPYKPYYHFMVSFRDRINKSSLPLFVRKMINTVCFGCFLAAKELRYFLQLRTIARKHKPGLIHLNNNLNSQFSGILLARRLGIPCVSHQRDFENRSWFARWLGQFVDHHIAISDAIRENLGSLGIRRGKVSVVADAVDVQTWTPDGANKNMRMNFGMGDGDRLVGIFGRVVPWKGQHVFVQAMKEVCKAFPDVRGFIVGDHSDGDRSYMENVREQIKALCLGDRIVLTGYREDVRDLMAMMDVVVHASTRPEPFGMVIIEAMALGKPVVATEGGGPSEIITDGKSGILVPREDSECLANAICALLHNPSYAKELGHKARGTVEERFSHVQQAEIISQIYSHLLNDQQEEEHPSSKGRCVAGTDASALWRK